MRGIVINSHAPLPLSRARLSILSLCGKSGLNPPPLFVPVSQVVNILVNGNPSVSPKSSSMYGIVTSVDQLMTFLLVNGACSLSDRYGRRPFL
jgi:hypothetical protein